MEFDTRNSFTETQRFNQWWLWLIIIASFAFPIYGAFSQLVLKKPFGNNPLSNGGMVILLLSILLMLALFWAMNLKTVISKDGVFVKFFPFHVKYNFYSWDTISKAYVREYSPLGEFGGWGVRFGRNCKAYNVKGQKGLQLEFSNNKKLLIGTQKADELDAYLYREGLLRK